VQESAISRKNTAQHSTAAALHAAAQNPAKMHAMLQLVWKNPAAMIY
jgi:hypothetical protein